MFQDASNVFLDWIQYPPGSMIFIFLLSLMVSSVSTLLTKLLVDTDEINRKQKLMKAHQEQKKKIIELAETNRDKYIKEKKSWEKRDAFIKKMQQGMAFSRLKPTCLTFLPMIIIFGFLRTIFLNNPVACPPMNPWDVPMLEGFVMADADQVYQWTEAVYGRAIDIDKHHGWINFTSFYFLCSLGTSTLLQRLLKIQTQASGGMEQMFSGQKAAASEFPEV